MSAKKIIIGLAVLAVLMIVLIILIGVMRENSDEPSRQETASIQTEGTVFALPDPLRGSDFTLEEALQHRRSVREYTDESATLLSLSQILWATQGISDPQRGFRTAPSAGALYPLSVRVFVSRVEGLPIGVYRYDVASHELLLLDDADRIQAVYETALSQSPVRQAAFNIVIAADYDITANRYGDRAKRYVHMEAGHAGQNLALQAVSCGLATVPIGAFDEARMRELAGLSEDETPLYLFPVGHPAP